MWKQTARPRALGPDPARLGHADRADPLELRPACKPGRRSGRLSAAAPAALAGINLQYGLTPIAPNRSKRSRPTTAALSFAPSPAQTMAGSLTMSWLRPCSASPATARAIRVGRCRGVLDWSTGIYNPRVDISKDTTTLYASDRDVFLFLVDDLNPIEAGRLRTARPISISAASTAGTRKSAPRRSAWRASISAQCAKIAICGAWKISRRSSSAIPNTQPPALRTRRPRRC